MRCARVGRWSGAYLPPRNPRIACPASRSRLHGGQRCQNEVRQETIQCQQVRSIHASSRRRQDTRPQASDVASTVLPTPVESAQDRRRPIRSAKVAAAHARLSLPPRFTQAAFARCLLHPSANPDPNSNNASLAVLGQELIAYYTAEWLICNYPRLPMPVIFAAQYAYSGDKTLSLMRHEWGIEAADAPGKEVDPGFLQFERVAPGNAMSPDMMRQNKDATPYRPSSGTGRPREQYQDRRGLSSRIVYDDEFGDLRSGVAVHDTAAALNEDMSHLLAQDPASSTYPSAVTLESASASFVRAVFGALYLYAGSSALQSFHQAHILSRHLPLHTLFNFRNPTRDLAKLCDREGFEPPVARLISETGRKSRTPVFVVGVYSGRDKLGEDAGASLNEARVRAAAMALRSWYLYSPPAEEICLPSRQGVMEKAGRRWRPQMVDPGEIVT